tara:strand:+ start:158 stop:301 length:144 start_codon:yes stop_codon:yes gene_type:complete
MNQVTYTRKSLGYHFDVLFQERLELFILAFIILVLIIWFFNDKIKAQ